VLCVTPEPRGADLEPESPAQALRDLGCELSFVGLDLEEVDEEALVPRPPNLVVIDTGDRLESAYGVLTRVRAIESLAEVPVLLCVPVSRLPSLDFAQSFDDFVLRPIVPAELYARVRQLDYRFGEFAGEETVKAGDLVIDLAGYEARWRGRLLDLTHQEFELLKFLAQNRGKVFTREQLLRRVWGYKYYGGSRTVDIHVRRLRSKLGEGEDLIQTVRNVGYKMRPAGHEDPPPPVEELPAPRPAPARGQPRPAARARGRGTR
jgi:DNA-binding response OmpR family regulator